MYVCIYDEFTIKSEYVLKKQKETKIFDKYEAL